jgi:membrane dipeptidase
MQLFDLHCDTLYKSVVNNKPIDSPDFEFNYSDFKKSPKWIQCMAMWIPDDVSELPEIFANKETIEFFKFGAEKLKSECERLGVHQITDKPEEKGFILTLENSSILNGKIENIDIISNYGVKIATLTWNGSNCVGDGAKVTSPKGLTDFGKLVVEEYNKRNIVIDLSHVSDKLFYDVASINKGKVVATHSNSRALCGNKRNLTDDQFDYIQKNGGLVGLNFHRYFLEDDGKGSYESIIRHAYHFLSLGGENVVAIGSDFDGSVMPDGLTGSESFENLYNEFIKNGFSVTTIEKIFYQNAYNFFEKL